MSTLTSYKQLQVVTPDPSGNGGLAINDNFINLADSIGPCNYTATTNPTTSDNQSTGYYAGSRWFNTSTSDEFVCISSTMSTAVWEQTTGGGATPTLQAVTDAGATTTDTVTLGGLVVDDINSLSGDGVTFQDQIIGPSFNGTIYQNRFEADATMYGGSDPRSHLLLSPTSEYVGSNGWSGFAGWVMQEGGFFYYLVPPDSASWDVTVALFAANATAYFGNGGVGDGTESDVAFFTSSSGGYTGTVRLRINVSQNAVQIFGNDFQLNDGSGSGGGNIVMDGGQIIQMAAENAGSAPSSPVVGQIYFDTTSNHFFGWNGSAWKQLDN